jgi:hypothetical protein
MADTVTREHLRGTWDPWSPWTDAAAPAADPPPAPAPPPAPLPKTDPAQAKKARSART